MTEAILSKNSSRLIPPLLSVSNFSKSFTFSCSLITPSSSEPSTPSTNLKYLACFRWNAKSDGDLFPRCLELSRSHFSISISISGGGQSFQFIEVNLGIIIVVQEIENGFQVNSGGGLSFGVGADDDQQNDGERLHLFLLFRPFLASPC